MLTHLKVRDLALVAESTVRFGPGLNLLTGETGSGKSLIIDALSLALGSRADPGQVRHGADRASVEAVFDSVALQREVGRRNVARVDGRPASPGQLRELGANLVAIHGQHQHHALLDTETQTDLLDAYAGALDMRAAVATAHGVWVAAAARVRDLEQLRSRGLREQEYLRWQLDELRKVDLKPGEDEAVGAERTASRHAARQAVESPRNRGAGNGEGGGGGAARAAAGRLPVRSRDAVPIGDRTGGRGGRRDDVFGEPGRADSAAGEGCIGGRAGARHAGDQDGERRCRPAADAGLRRG